ncbi:MAG: TonB-dependent receptor [Betaproteobacteria bacterium]|nr:MAG: TonB-dependent receptor [Betaproteobacteria bacterium]
MFRKTKICSGLMLAFGGSLVLSALPAAAQQQLERVEITGSSIKRINAETSLPVQVITAEDIKKSGFTSAVDLIQSLPSMQGFLTASQSVNGGGGGVTNASLHSIGSQYTLVLLNGRRVAPYNTGTTVDLNSIPLSSIERIEVLLDGASAVYGADAIAGVVNFITEKNSSEGEVSLTATLPQHPGAKSGNFSISKGFGDLDKDRFNVFLAFSLDKQRELNAEQRDFSKTGFIPFTDQGRNLTTFLSSSNSIPGTVILTDNGTVLDASGQPTGAGDAFYSPDFLATGKCGPRTKFRAGVCRFDFASTVQAIPESERKAAFGTLRFKVSDGLTLLGEASLADFNTKPRFAPPAQPGIPLTQALVDAHVTPYLATLGVPPGSFYPVGDPSGLGPSMNLRVYDAGGRQDEYRTKIAHLVLGAEGTISDIDYSGYVVHSQNKFTDTMLSGYLSSNAFTALVQSGAFDPLSAQIGQSTAVLAPAVLHQVFDQTKSTLDTIHGQLSKPLMKLGGGDLALALGAESARQRFIDNPSAIDMGQNKLQPNFTDSPIGGSSGALPFDSKRNSTGLFAELVAPVIKGLELSGSLRHDSFGAVKNATGFDADGNPLGAITQGKSAAATTYKLSARYQPVSELLFRGSVGTGFKVPTLKEITFPVQAFGSTGFHDCPPGLDPTIAARCSRQAGAGIPAEYNLRQGGNPATDASGLQPEKSKQWTLGFRVEPDPTLSVGVDLWSVRIKQRIDFVPEDAAFNDGVTYGSAFAVIPDPVTGLPTLTFTQIPQNLGRSRYRGLDFDATSRIATPLGRLTTKGTFTYMIQSEYEILGLAGYQSSLGKIGPDTNAVFRWLLNVGTSLEMGNFTHTLNAQVKPSYTDQEAASHLDAAGNTVFTGAEVRVLNPNGSVGGRRLVKRTVGSYSLFDWQTKYAVNKSLAFTFGIKNIFDRKPPFSIQDESGTGNMRGFDARYADPIGRAYYLSGNYKF